MDGNKKKTFSKINTKDVVYLFSIFFLVYNLIMLVVWRFSSAKLLVDQVSFGSSIASMALAIVVMIYAFVQTQQSSAQNEVMNETLHRINSKNEIVQDALQKINIKIDELKILKSEMDYFKELQTLNNCQIKDAIELIASDLSELKEGIKVPEKEIKKVEEIKQINDSASNSLSQDIYSIPVADFDSIPFGLAKVEIGSIINSYKQNTIFTPEIVYNDLISNYNDEFNDLNWLRKIDLLLHFFNELGYVDRCVHKDHFVKVRPICIDNRK